MFEKLRHSRRLATPALLYPSCATAFRLSADIQPQQTPATHHQGLGRGLDLDLNTDGKIMSETEVLRAFASTQQALWGKDPKRARGEQPDFVYKEEGIGVELARWAHESESQTEKEHKRLQDEIREAVKWLKLKQFDFGR